jgi:predicted small lipoprotein YifL
MEIIMKSKILALLILLAMLVGLAACGTPAPPPGPTPAPPTPTPRPPSSSFDLEKLLIDVFDPQPGEKVLVMMDLPPDRLSDYGGWSQRREMAYEWHAAFERLGSELGISVYPLLTYPATGAHSGPLPEQGEMGGQAVRFEEILADTNIVVALTEYSATGPLSAYTETFPNLRAASMPAVSRSMERTALSADYAEVARKSQLLAAKLDEAEGAMVEFSTGHEMYFDLRYREAHADDGQLHADKEGARIINLPSGEAYMAPYEGEAEGEPSRTEGTIPVMLGDELVLATVEENRIVEVIGDGPEAAEARDYLARDEALRNVAELGLGCNDKAVVTGNVLEDEKVMGMHWAYGLSEHIGGAVGVDDFSDPSHVEHRDWVYPKGGAIEITSLVLEYEDGTTEEIIKDGVYTIF